MEKLKICSQHSNILQNIGMWCGVCYGMMMKQKIKTARQLERHFKGVSNHHRINIICFVAEHEKVGLEDIAEHLDCNFKTISEHTKKLAHAGLINKKYNGRIVEHSLSPYGKIFYRFITTFSHH